MERGLLFLALLVPALALAQPTPCVDGFAGAYPCQNVDLLAQPTDRGATDIWGWTDPDTGTEYAIIFLSSRTTFFDLSDPTAPVEIGSLSNNAGKDARVYANHLFVVDDGGLPGMLVFDLTRLRDVANPPVVFEVDAVYDGISRAHNLTLDTESGFAFPVLPGGGLCSSELHIVDVRDPVNPTFAGCYDRPRFDAFHDAHCITYDGPDTEYAGRELCFGSAGTDGVIEIVDVTDKANPQSLSSAPYPNAAYTHQGWLTEDSRYFLMNDEFDEGTFGFNTRTLVFDVSDLDEPEFAFAYEAETAATDHNLFVKGDYAYQANYGAGFRMLDLSEIDSGTLTEVAFFDTSPEGVNGALWGVYPFFESGIVIASDRSRGLFVFQPTVGQTLDTEAAPQSGIALAAYPNPFASRATVALTVGAAQQVTVAVYDVLGREVAVLYDGLVGAGEERAFSLDGAGLPTGAYLVRATGETFRATQALTLVR
ncbi:MAG: choice-of-anchor B family protein [Bacteroidota bacterium]